MAGLGCGTESTIACRGQRQGSRSIGSHSYTVDMYWVQCCEGRWWVRGGDFWLLCRRRGAMRSLSSSPSSSAPSSLGRQRQSIAPSHAARRSHLPPIHITALPVRCSIPAAPQPLGLCCRPRPGPIGGAVAEVAAHREPHPYITGCAAALILGKQDSHSHDIKGAGRCRGRFVPPPLLARCHMPIIHLASNRHHGRQREQH